MINKIVLITLIICLSVFLTTESCTNKKTPQDFNFTEKQYFIGDKKLDNVFNQMDLINSRINKNNKIEKVSLTNSLLFYSSDVLIKAIIFDNDTISSNFKTGYYFFDDYCIVSLNQNSEKKILHYKLYLYDNDSLISCLVKNRNSAIDYTNITNNPLAVKASESIVDRMNEFKRLK